MEWFYILHKMGPVEPLEVPVETRAAAVENVASPVDPVDKSPNPSEAPEALSFSRFLPFLLVAVPRYHILITPDLIYCVHCSMQFLQISERSV